MTRTAATLVVLTGNARARSRTTLDAATEAFARLTSDQPCGPIRFTGYEPHTALPTYDLPADARVARYEADYPDA